MTTASTAAKTSDKATAKTNKPEAKAAAPEEKKGVVQPDDGRKRVNYNPAESDGTLKVSYGAEVMTLDAGKEVMHDPTVMAHLAYMGLITYLQRESSRARDEQKLDAIDEAYAALVEGGMKAFERKSNAPKGPKKADKIAALAMLKGRTPDAIRDALKKVSQAEQDKLLNHPKVLAKVEELRSGDAEDLSV